MARKAKKDIYAGMKGWEIQYLKKSEAYGHLTPTQGKGSSNKQRNKYKG